VVVFSRVSGVINTTAYWPVFKFQHDVFIGGKLNIKFYLYFFQ